MTRKRRETLTATALVAAIAGATFAQVLDRPSPHPSPPAHADLMPVRAPEAHHHG
jgi:Spy/CpxP family protein refolding chaperone